MADDPTPEEREVMRAAQEWDFGGERERFEEILNNAAPWARKGALHWIERHHFFEAGMAFERARHQEPPDAR